MSGTGSQPYKRYRHSGSAGTPDLSIWLSVDPNGREIWIIAEDGNKYQIIRDLEICEEKVTIYDAKKRRHNIPIFYKDARFF